MFGNNVIGSQPFGGLFPNTLNGYANPDILLRQKNLTVTQAYKLEVAWGGDLLRTRNSSGTAYSDYDLGLAPMNGNRTHWVTPRENVDTVFTSYMDYDRNWALYATSGAFQPSFSTSVTVNELVVYWHPIYNYPTNCLIKISNDGGSTFTTLWDGPCDKKVVIRSNTNLTFNQIYVQGRNIQNPHPTDGFNTSLKLVAVEGYLYVDESDKIVRDDNSGPRVTITQRFDDSQNSLSSPSECIVVLDNVDGRYSPFNASSEIYGVAQLDGMGSGVRTGVRARITAQATDENSNSFSQKVYSGFITDDASPGGSTGIIFNEQEGTATLNLKSFLSLLDQNIVTPAYPNAFWDYIIKNVCNRCNIALQDIDCEKINYSVPYCAFGETTGTSIVQEMANIIPSLSIQENYDDSCWIRVNNNCRNRGNMDHTRYVSAANTVKFMIPYGDYIFFFHDSDTALYKWDTKQPMDGEGVETISSAGMPTVIVFACTYKNRLYFCVETCIWYSFDMNATSSTWALTTHGQIDATYNNFFGAVIEKGSSFLFLAANNGATPHIFCWDLRKDFSTAVDKGASPNTNEGNGAIGAWNGYLVIQRSNNFPVATGFHIWNYGTTPLTTTMTFTTATHVTDDMNTATQCACFIPDNATISGYVYMVIRDLGNTGLPRMSVWKFNIASGLANPTTEKASFVKEFTSDPLVASNTSNYDYSTKFGMLINGTYMYIFTNFDRVLVWNISNNSTDAFFLGNTNTAIETGNKPFTNINSFGGATQWTSMGSVSCVDDSNRVWARRDTTVSAASKLYCYYVQGASDATPAALASFNISDDFTENIQVAAGNPECNRVILESGLMDIAGSNSTLWTSIKTMYVPYGVSVYKFTYSSSRRGFGRATGTHRYITIGGTNIWDDPTYSTTVTIDTKSITVKFVGFSDTGYVMFQNTSGTEVGVGPTGAVVTGRALSQAQQNVLDIKDAASIDLNRRREFVKSISSDKLNDESFYQDYLLNGRWSKLYADPIELPWYPILKTGQPINLTNSMVTDKLFKVMEHQTDGFRTKVKAKEYPQSFFI